MGNISHFTGTQQSPWWNILPVSVNRLNTSFDPPACVSSSSHSHTTRITWRYSTSTRFKIKQFLRWSGGWRRKAAWSTTIPGFRRTFFTNNMSKRPSSSPPSLHRLASRKSSWGLLSTTQFYLYSWLLFGVILRTR